MKHFVETEAEITAAGTKKSYDIFEKQRNERTLPKSHTHSYYELLLVTEGEQIYQIELDTQIKLHPGDALFVPSFIPHATYRTSDATMRCIVVKFSPTYLYPSEVSPSDVSCLLISPTYKHSHYLFRRDDPQTSELAQMMRKVLTELNGQRLGYEIEMRGILSSLYVWLLRNCENDVNDQCSNLKLDAYDSQKLYQILQFLTDNYQYTLSMTQVAEICNMSYFQFSRFFKKATGRNFNDYLVDMRLNYAQKKLLKAEESISEIAATCGFEYVSYFIRKFKEKHGVTPKQYQKMYQTISQPNDK